MYACVCKCNYYATLLCVALMKSYIILGFIRCLASNQIHSFSRPVFLNWIFLIVVHCIWLICIPNPNFHHFLLKYLYTCFHTPSEFILSSLFQHANRFCVSAGHIKPCLAFHACLILRHFIINSTIIILNFFALTMCQVIFWLLCIFIWSSQLIYEICTSPNYRLGN